MSFLKHTILFFLVVSTLSLYSQDTEKDSNSQKIFKTFVHLGNELADRKSQAVRQRASDSLNEVLVNYVYNKKIDFDALGKIPNMGVLHDKDLLICTWAVKKQFGVYGYYGFIRRFNKKKDAVQVIPLVQDSNKIADTNFKMLSVDEWQGAIYYKMIPVKNNGKTYYTLLGWNGGNMLYNEKIIDVLYFKNNQAFFGYSLFKNVPKQTGIMRFTFEYTEKAVMSLKYRDDKKAIIFNQLEPASKDLQGMQAFYGPLLTFNALILNDKNGLWYFKQNYKAENKKTKNDRLYHAPQ